MADFPAAGSRSLPLTVWTGSRFGIGVGARELAGGSTAFASTAWGTANLAILTPIWLPFRYPVRNLFVMNGATLGGNVDVGIYNQDLTLITSSGSVAQAGISAIQAFAKDLILRPGGYYLGLSSNSTTATYFAAGIGSATRERYMGLLQMGTAFPLPATFTAAAVAQARVPAVGFTFQTSVTF